jgi:iron complex outermembrane receptor protein
MKRPTGILAGVALSVLVCGTAHAQAAPATTTATPAEGGIQEIVVTAQKRSENVQNVPIAISAFTANALKERAVGDVSQLSGLSPNVTLDASTPFSGSSAVLGASIRGVGAADFAFNIDSAVGVYVDGVYLGRSVGANQDLLDVDRIEVLKGPQGTLFGRNTIGGAISIVTHDPGNTFRFVGDFTGGSYNRAQARMTMDVPLTDNLTSSISFGIMNREGYQRRIPYPTTYTTDAFTSFAGASWIGGDDRYGGDNNWNMRGKLKYTGANGFKAVVEFDYTHVNQESTASTLLGTDTGPASLSSIYNACINIPAAALTTPGLAGICGPRGGVNGYNTLPGLAGQAANGYLPYGNQFITGNIDTTYATGQNYSKVNQLGVGLTLEQPIGAALLKSITSFRKVDLNAGTNQDGSPLNILMVDFTVFQHQWSQEFQLTGKAADDKLNYVFGGYFFNETGNLHDYVNFDDGILQVDGPGRINTVALAAYSQLDYKFSDLISVTAGARYTHEHKNYYGGQADDNGLSYKLPFNLTPNAANAAFLGFPYNNNYSAGFQYGANLGPLAQYLDYFPAEPNSQDFNNFSPKLGIQIHPSQSTMAYFSWSKGYKSGGWTTRLSAPLLAAPTFGPEHATTYELGFKSTLFDRKLQVNAAVFDTQYNGIQLNEQIGASPTVFNLGKAINRGAELEATIAPGGGFTVQSSLSYLDAHYTYVCGEGGVFQPFCNGNSAYIAPGSNPYEAGVYAGAPLPKAPHWKINLSPRYEIQLPKGKLVLLADWTHTTSLWNDSLGTYLIMRAGTDIVNASATYKAPDGNWDLTVGGTNLTNDRYLITGDSNLAAGAITGTYNRPAEWYVRLGVRF